MQIETMQYNGDSSESTAAAAAAAALLSLPDEQKKSSRKVKYIKAPGAPKRFKTAFIFFTIEKHSQVRKQVAAGIYEVVTSNGVVTNLRKTSEVAKLISKEWREMPPNERFKWDEIARKDKERWLIEKEEYKGPWKVKTSSIERKISAPAASKRSRKPKHPLAPKRPASAFLLFSRFKRPIVKKDYLSKGEKLISTEVSKILGRIWNQLPHHEKETFINKEAELRIKYKKNGRMEQKASCNARRIRRTIKL